MAMLISLLLAIAMALIGSLIAPIFTDDATTQNLILSLLLVWIFVEPGRAINLTVISALKGSGDVVFPVQIGIVVMWGVGVFFAWLLGIHWAWGLVGIWIGVGLDEWVRGIIMIFRWRSDAWVSKALVMTDD